MKNNQKFKFEKTQDSKRKQNSSQGLVKHTHSTAHVKKD